MDTKSIAILKKQLVKHLKGGQAFRPVDHLLEKISFDEISIKPAGLPYSYYQQFYHLRFAQLDILEYCRNSNYQHPAWPDDYWPGNAEPSGKEEWNRLKKNYLAERKEFCNLILDPSQDLFKPLRDSSDHTLLREAQLVIEHSAYHVGQLYVIWRLL